MSDTRPMCVKCSGGGLDVRYRCEKNEVAIRYGPPSDLLQPATEHSSILVGDLWKCPECGNEIVIGFAHEKTSPHDRPDLAEFILAVARAIDASDKPYVPLDQVRADRRVILREENRAHQG